MLQAESTRPRYERQQRIDQGGFATVYAARDRESGELVALKELTRPTPFSLALFKKEFRAIQAIRHPNLVRLDALFEERGKWFIAMELIEGTDLISYVYSPSDTACFDEARLRATFLQLTEGLTALHAQGYVHRDVKPKNVKVTPSGRVVLLDFGLIEPITRHASSATHQAGSIAYAAPEQFSAGPVGPAADFYALGVCLHEALTGVVPIDGETPSAILRAKQAEAPQRASESADGVPRDLDQLCCELLSLDPMQRPEARAVSRVLSGVDQDASAVPRSTPPRLGREPVFMGRVPELKQLQDALNRARERKPTLVLVEGESGIGKSTLVEHFLDSAQNALVLRARCYEHELIAYKGLDAAIEALSHRLRAMPDDERRRLLPPRAALLGRLFPTLKSVPGLSRTLAAGASADPAVQRIDAFAAFAELFARLSLSQPVIVAIDDLQWADAETFALLGSWVAERPAHCLVIATLRPRAELDREAAEGVERLRNLPSVRTLFLGGLATADARAVTQALLTSKTAERYLDTIVNEAGGQPFLLTMLAHFAQNRVTSALSELNVEQAIAARIGALPGAQRTLLELAAIAGTPIPIALCGRATRLREPELGRSIAELCQKRLLRRRRAGEITCFHDRIRRCVEALLPQSERRSLHADIAGLLSQQTRTDFAELARHQEAAGQLELALDAYERSADRALQGLAFVRAIQLYDRALELSMVLKRDVSERVALKIGRAHALARSGRGALSARAYLEVARDAGPAAQTQLRLLGAVHLLQGAHVDEGLSTARDLLAQLGVMLPTSTTGTRMELLWDRAVLRVRGIDRTTARARADRQARVRLEALWGLATPTSWVDPLLGASLIARHSRLACALGDPDHMARALAEEAFVRHLRRPNDPKVSELLARARSLCDRCNDPALELTVSFREGTVAMVRWDLERALERLEHAERVAMQRCPGEPWLLTNVRVAMGGLFTFNGNTTRLAGRTQAWLAEARERNDQFALSLIETLGAGFMRHLLLDRPDDARAATAAAMAPWPREPFSFAHLGELLAVLASELYRGGASAWEWLEDARPRLERAFVLKTDFARAGALFWMANAAIGAAVASQGAERNRLLREARRIARPLGRINMQVAFMLAGLIDAQLRALSGERREALERVRQTQALARAFGYRALLRVLTYLEGLLEGGTAGRETPKEMLAQLAEAGAANPRRMAAMMCPAIDALE